MTQNTPLIIYRASAGSGKTFTLATEYIKLVVQNPQAYKQILAVTFTNKATEEMKMRILSQLYGIWRQLPDSKGYTDAVCRDLDASPEFVSHQAGIALTNLLHNYSYFRIETIDSFFQSVLRNLARELELTANIAIELDDKQVEAQAVDELIENLSAQDLMLQWILDYIKNTISEDRSWNIINKLKDFGITIFKDFYKKESQALYARMSQPGFFDNYVSTLEQMRQNAKKRMQSLGERFFKILKENGLEVGDFTYGSSGVASVFVKLQRGDDFKSEIINTRVRNCEDNPEGWCKKTHPRRDEIVALAHGSLNALLKEVIQEQPRQWSLYQSATLTLRHLSQLRLLESIESKVRELNKGANRFLLSDTQKLLHDLIDGSDSPFIFEKIGTQLEHIMIDEFQDTSTVQWQNFKVLLQETMSHEASENLIVGDVKQSIYRWRNGDWRLLNNILQEFPDASNQLNVRTLATNYRSCRRVINFNNAFFTQASQIMQLDAYGDVKQDVPENKGDEGYIRIELKPADSYQEQVLSTLMNQIAELINANIPTSDIAILVRTNRFIPEIANYFMEHMPQVPIVSDEAFRLDASPAVQTIVQAIRYLTDENDHIAKAFLASTYSHLHPYLEDLDSQLPTLFVSQRDELRQQPLYELTERLFSIFDLQQYEGQSAYLCAFYDYVTTFVNEQTTDLKSFLKRWDEYFCSKTIQSPEVNGIRIISIHKSKGLEFPYVFIPFCDWKMEQNDVLWFHPKKEPFNELPIVPIDYSKSGMENTIYEAEYNEEHQQVMVDNMNLLYVAFTRASRVLSVIGKRNSGQNYAASIIEATLPLLTNQLAESCLENVEDEGQPIIFEYGNLSDTNQIYSKGADSQSLPAVHASTKKVEDTPHPNVFLRQSAPIVANIEAFAQKVEFKQSNDSRKFALPDDDDEAQQQANYIQTGSILHEVFSTIRTTADIDNALRRMELDGILYDSHLTRERIEDLIRKRISHPQVAQWYDAKWKLFNECTILATDPHTVKTFERRPDRVMTDGHEMIVVDFKFGRPRQEYHQQVQEYMDLLASMGYNNIHGYLWYVYSNHIEEV